jgi:hypothetical protein
MVTLRELFTQHNACTLDVRKRTFELRAEFDGTRKCCANKFRPVTIEVQRSNCAGRRNSRGKHEGTTTMRNIWLNIDTTTGRHDFGAKHSNPKWIQLQMTRDDFTNHRETILSTFKPLAA